MKTTLYEAVLAAQQALKGRRLDDIPVLRMDERGRLKALEHMAEPLNEWGEWQPYYLSEAERFFSNGS